MLEAGARATCRRRSSRWRSRSSREAVRNAHKHAEPTRVERPGRTLDGAFVLEVVNDGVAGRGAPAGMGLRLAALEALQSGGVVEFGEREPGTWQVRLVVPPGEPDG